MAVGGDLMKRWHCTICGHIYDPAEGDPDTGVPPGTPFENLPESWVCPDCGATKADFEEMAS
jgi:rubredoxin